MKKTNKNAVLLFVLLVAVAVSALLVASTYAKYTAEVEGSGTVKVALWKFEEDNETTDFTIKLDQTYDATTLVGDRIAPGTKGNFEIELSNEQSEVGVDFTIKLTDTTNVPKNLVFKSGTTTIDPTSGEITGQIKPGDTLKVPVSWEWVYYTNDTEDAEDTTDGKAGNTMEVKATITGVQTTPSTTAITTHIDA